MKTPCRGPSPRTGLSYRWGHSRRCAEPARECSPHTWREYACQRVEKKSRPGIGTSAASRAPSLLSRSASSTAGSAAGVDAVSPVSGESGSEAARSDRADQKSIKVSTNSVLGSLVAELACRSPELLARNAQSRAHQPEHLPECEIDESEIKARRILAQPNCWTNIPPNYPP